jgi:hypothetical protein
MARIRITATDGKSYMLNVPDGVEPEAAVAEFESNVLKTSLDTSKPKLDPTVVQRAHVRASDSLAPPSLSLGDVAEGVAENWKDSAVNLGNSLIQPIIHPIDTAKAVGNLALGVGSKAVDAIPGVEWKDKEAKAERESSADAVGQFYKDRYGSLEGVKRAVATDPFGVAADVGTVLSGGGGAAARLPGVAGKAGEIVRATGRAIDPVANVTRAATGIADVTLPKGASKLKDVPTGDELKAASHAAYKKADDAGIIVAQPALRQLHAQVADDLTEFGYDADLHPRIKTALGKLDKLAKDADEAGNPIHTTLKGLDITRRVVNAAGDSLVQGEKALAGKITERIDDLVARLDQPGNAIMGDAAKGAEALKEARALWHQQSKATLIDNAIKGAQLRAATTGSGGNVENAIRQELRKLLTNRKTARAFNREEKAAIMRAASGSTAQNMLRQLGKLAPSGVVSMGLGGGIGATIGTAVGMPMAGMVAVPALGALAKAASDRGTRLSAEALHKAALGGQIARAAPRQAPVGAAQGVYQIGDIPNNEEEQKRRLREILMRRAAADRGQ